jgi:DNA-binding transcriptional MerR regulator
MANDSPTLEGYLQIGEASAHAEVTQRTLRYYEEKGLLKPPTRMEGGFRLYSPEDMERVERIKELRDLLGFSLADIKEMVEAEDVRTQLRAEWRKDADLAEKITKMQKARELTIQQIALIDDKMMKMAGMRSQLAERLVRYDNWLANNAEQELAASSQGAAAD